MKLILLRHGESQWNLENRFTGWKDVDLTEAGISEARFSGKKLRENHISINSIHTSILLRATRTAKIVAQMINFSEEAIKYDWRLNERHYGALQGLNKSETAAKYGEDQVHIWRRSYDISPPLLSQNDKRHPRFIKKFAKINSNLPRGESLENVIERLKPFWEKYVNEIKKSDNNHLIVAHSNSLRAIVKLIENLSNKEILKLNIPTGVPLLYEFDDNFEIINKEYLIDKKLLRKKQSVVEKQGKVK